MNKKRQDWIRLIIFFVFGILFYCLLFPVLSVIIGALRKGLLNEIQWQRINSNQFLILVLPLLISFIAVIYIGLLIASMFPKLTLVDNGIEYRSLLSSGLIQWAEILRITRSRLISNLRIIVIQRKGASLLRPKGLVFPYVHGIWLGVNAPVIILWSNPDEIIDKIASAQAENPK